MAGKERILAGVDVGNATTEAAIARLSPHGELVFLGSSAVGTTGTKGTPANVEGILKSLKAAASDSGIELPEIQKVMLNHATPVLGDFAMDTVTKTTITDSTMIGHNPDTPGGEGLGKGKTARIDGTFEPGVEYVILVPEEWDYQDAAGQINLLAKKGVLVTAAIVQKDEGVLIANRLESNIPILDEVPLIDRIPLGMPAACEVAPPGHVIDMLSNPYGIATVLGLSPKEADYCSHIARALLGNRSAVVIKTPLGDVSRRVIPAGNLRILGEPFDSCVPVDAGAEAINSRVAKMHFIRDVKGDSGSNIGGMLEHIRGSMAEATGIQHKEICINDLYAVDVMARGLVQGGLAGEMGMERGTLVCAMVKTHREWMDKVARQLQEALGARVLVQGTEAETALMGALTTPGASLPLAVLDAGAGSTDVAYMEEDGRIKTVHGAGAGNMVSMMIESELSLPDFDTAELVKKYPLAKVISLQRIQYESGKVELLETALPPDLLGGVVALTPGGMVRIPSGCSMERIIQVRRKAKEKVLVGNVLRVLDLLDEKEISHVMLVGGSFLDFEAPGMVANVLFDKGISTGKGNIRGTQGPRNAVATGLVLKEGRKGTS